MNKAPAKGKLRSLSLLIKDMVRRKRILTSKEVQKTLGKKKSDTKRIYEVLNVLMGANVISKQGKIIVYSSKIFLPLFYNFRRRRKTKELNTTQEKRT